MRVGYLGPEGTYSEEALLSSPLAATATPVPFRTERETIVAVQAGEVERGIVPIENSLGGSVGSTLDALALDAPDVTIVGETVHGIHHCLIARPGTRVEDVTTVVSHPQASAQCARFLRERLGNPQVLPATSTAEAVRSLAGGEPGWAAIGNRLAAELYGCEVLDAGIEDVEDNETRFVFLARGDGHDAVGEPGEHGWKTSVVFWGVGADKPGWLVRCLSEFAFRGVNLTKIESRPMRGGLGQYMFFADLEGRREAGPVTGAIDGLREQAETLRVLGSYPAVT
jgi:prephenate dehydratase